MPRARLTCARPSSSLQFFRSPIEGGGRGARVVEVFLLLDVAFVSWMMSCHPELTIFISKTLASLSNILSPTQS